MRWVALCLLATFHNCLQETPWHMRSCIVLKAVWIHSHFPSRLRQLLSHSSEKTAVLIRIDCCSFIKKLSKKIFSWSQNSYHNFARWWDWFGFYWWVFPLTAPLIASAAFWSLFQIDKQHVSFKKSSYVCSKRNTAWLFKKTSVFFQDWYLYMLIYWYLTGYLYFHIDICIAPGVLPADFWIDAIKKSGEGR